MKKIVSVLTAVFYALFVFDLSISADNEDNESENKKISYTLCTVLVEAATGTVISGENENVRVPVGTLPKLMTVLLTAEEIECGNLKLDTRLKVGKEAENVPGAVIWLTLGENVSVEELLKAVIIGNANDAAAVLAANIGNDENDFVGMMNARAFEMGMRDTVYQSCGGKDGAGEYSTAADTAILAAELLKYDFLREYFTTWSDRVRDGQTEVVNENRLVRTYDGITGMKAGHSEQSGFSLVLTAERDGAAFISVVLGCGDKDERFSIGKTLVSKGFSSYKVTTPAFSNEFLRPVTVHGGVEKAVEIQAGQLKELVIPKNSGELSTVVLIPEYVEAPVRKGQIIGKVGFYNNDTLLFETDIIASQAVEEMNFLKALKNYLHIMYK